MLVFLTMLFNPDTDQRFEKVILNSESSKSALRTTVVMPKRDFYSEVITGLTDLATKDSVIENLGWVGLFNAMTSSKEASWNSWGNSHQLKVYGDARDVLQTPFQIRHTVIRPVQHFGIQEIVHPVEISLFNPSSDQGELRIVHFEDLDKDALEKPTELEEEIERQSNAYKIEPNLMHLNSFYLICSYAAELSIPRT